MPTGNPFPIARRTVLIGGVMLLGRPALAQQSAPAVPTAPATAKGILALTPRSFALKPGAAESRLISINGNYGSPVLRAKKDQPFELTVNNGLDQPTAIQIHGLRAANSAEAMPGLNAKPILPGETRIMTFIPPDSGVFLYLPVMQGRAAEQRERGLAGMFIVEEPSPQAVDIDYTAVLDDIVLKDGALGEGFGQRAEAARFGRLGNALVINNLLEAQTIRVRPNGRVRLRLANVANARVMPMKFVGGVQTVVAIDGQSCEPFDPLKRAVVLLPGSRYEVMIDAPATAGQDAGVFIETGGLHPVLNIRTEGEPLPQRPDVVPLPVNDVPPSIRLQNSVRAEIAISGGLERDANKPVPDNAELVRRWPDAQKIFQINNGFNAGLNGKPVVTVKRGTPVVLALSNRTAWPQVITIHGHVFRLLHPMDDGWEPYFLDTIHLPPMTTSRIAFDASNPGKWAICSTIAEHYDAGVATWFEVT